MATMIMVIVVMMVMVNDGAHVPKEDLDGHHDHGLLDGYTVYASVLLVFGAEMVGNSPFMRTKGQIGRDLIWSFAR